MPEGAARRAHNVIDLAAWRSARRPESVSEEILAEVDAASRVYEALLAQGHELSFDVSEAAAASRVRAELRAISGDVVRDVSLGEVVGIDAPPAA